MFFPLSLLYLRLIFIDFSIIVSSLRVASDDKQTFQQNIHHAIDAKFFSINQYVSLAEVLKACDYEDERFAAVIYYLIFGAWAQLALTATWLSIKIALWSCCEILRASFLLLAGMTMLPEMVALSTAKAQLYFLGHDVVQNRFCSTLFVAVVNFIGALCCTFPLTTKVATVLTPSMAVVMAVMILLYPFIRIVRHYYLNSLAETGNRSLWGVSRNQGKYIEKIHTPYESKDDVLMALRVIGYVGIVAALMYGLHAVYDKIPTPIDMINFITEKPRIQDSATGLSVVMMFAIMWAGCTVVSSIVIGCCIVRTSEEAAPAKEKRAPFFNDDCKEDLLLLRSARSADPSVLGANRFVIAEIPGAYCI